MASLIRQTGLEGAEGGLHRDGRRFRLLGAVPKYPAPRVLEKAARGAGSGSDDIGGAGVGGESAKCTEDDKQLSTTNWHKDLVVVIGVGGIGSS